MSDTSYPDPGYILGIDLHGTMLDGKWQINRNHEKELLQRLTVVKKHAPVYICTGNDYSFVEKYLPESVIKVMSGFVLETGCLIRTEGKQKRLTDQQTVSRVKQLEQDLKKIKFNQVLYFARRDTTVSMFTRDEQGGADPQDLFEQVVPWIKNSEYQEMFNITHSSVAVDIIPVGFNKYRGLLELSGGKEIICIADSRNDLTMISNADYSFVPANAYGKLDILLGDRKMVSIDNNLIDFKQVVVKSKSAYTSGVIEILNFLNRNLFHEN
ncbi:MAG: HAD hydrolase family protein [bacterium]